MLRTRSFTKKLKQVSVWLWSLGLAFAVADNIYFSLGEYKISFSYIFFFSAAIACLWAEKREFGTRVTLYRIHDLLIYSSWKYLLLYFLWINLFAMFTETPLKSILYAASGCFNLIAVAIIPQLLFCERTLNNISLLPSRLKIAFYFFTLSQAVLLLSVLLPLFLPEYPFPKLINNPLELFLYFMIGFPFLLWDFSSRSRRLLPRTLSGVTMMIGIVSVLIAGGKFFILSLFFCFATYFAFAVYKKIRLKGMFFSSIFLMFFSLLFLFLVDRIPNFSPMKSIILQEIAHHRTILEYGLKNSISGAINIAKETHYLGVGVGVLTIKGVWTRVFAEAGIIGLFFYTCFFLSVLKNLYFIRHEVRLVISNIAFISMLYFLFFGSHYVANPYGPSIWVWYAIWFLFSSTKKKKEFSNL